MVARSAQTGEDLSELTGLTPEQIEYERRAAYAIMQTTSMLLDAQMIRISKQQAEVFLTIPAIEGQDARWMHLPFPKTFLQFDSPMIFDNYISGDLEVAKSTQRVHGALLLEAKTTPEEQGKIVDMYGQIVEDVDTYFQIVWLMPEDEEVFLQTHTAILTIMRDGTLRMFDQKNPDALVRNRMLIWMIHMINFLSSPSVKLSYRTPDLALQKARQRRGKAPLPGWYEITYRKQCGDYTKNPVTEKKWEHSFRYDVRGHFKQFQRGRMAGRVIWSPPHQRGLKNELYKPKIYTVTQ
jgi:hypothetical protein